jgi:hypothetical protein
MISVLIPARNCARWIEDAVRSVARQTVAVDEILVADDASDDGTPDLVESMGLRSVRVLRSPERLGISRQLNRMIELAAGRYLARMDGDDISHPQRLEKQLRAMERRDLGIVGSWARRFEAASTEHRFATDDPAIKAGLLFSVPFCHPSVVFDREKVGEFRYDPEFDMAEDHHLWIGLRGKTTYGNVPEFLLNWRMHGRNVGTVASTAKIQRTLASRSRDQLLSAYSVSLTARERGALEARALSETLDLDRTRDFLDALLSLARIPEDRLGAPRTALSRAIVGQWNLSCLFSAWNTPGIPSLWWQGCRRLGIVPSYQAGAKILLKRLSKVVRGA